MKDVFYAILVILMIMGSTFLITKTDQIKKNGLKSVVIEVWEGTEGFKK